MSREDFREWVAAQDPNMPLYSQGESGVRQTNIKLGSWSECPVDRWQYDVHGAWTVALGYDYLYGGDYHHRVMAVSRGTWAGNFAQAIDGVADSIGWENVTAKHALKVLDDLEVASA